MAIARYPRFGQLLAPATLRAVLDVPVSSRLKGRFTHIKWKGIRLADLDATSWERFGERACKVLAQIIVEQVGWAIRCSMAAIYRQRLPKVDGDLSIDDLSLGTRTSNCLYRAHLNEDVRRLGDLFIGDLLALRSFGAKSLVDLLAALETVPNVPGTLFPSKKKLSWIEWARSEDLRLPPNAGEWLFPALPPTLTWEQLNISAILRHHLRELGLEDNVSALSGYPMGRLLEIHWFGAFRLRTLLRRLDAVLHPPPLSLAPDLEMELLNLFLPDYQNEQALATRNRGMFLRRYGLDGQGGATLEAISKVEGIQRERVRQVCVLRRPVERSAPRLESALQVIDKLVPAPVAGIEDELIRRGLTSQHLPLKSLVRFAHVLGYPLSFKLISGGCFCCCWAVRPDEHSDLLICLIRIIKWRMKHYGAASFAEVIAQLARHIHRPVDPALARRFLCTFPGLYWLDEAMDWFWLRSHTKNFLLQQARRILAARGRSTVDELCDAVRRLPYIRFASLPPHVLSNFCRTMPGVRLEGDEIIAS